jgi:glucose/mannose transport system permease protein
MSADIVDRITHSTAPKKNRRQLSGVAQFWLIFRYISLTIILAMVILPIYVLVVNSFKGISGVYLNTAFELPKTLNFETWSAAWDWLAVPMGRTLLFVTQSSIISALIGSINGYVLSKWRFTGSNAIFMLFLFGMFIPYQAIMIPLTQFNKAVGLTGSIYVLVLAHVVYGIPICTLIFRNYYASIPDEIIEAGRVDGASMVRIYRAIILPLSIPAFVVVLIWQFTSAWNDFLFAIFLTGGSPKLAVATTALNWLTGSSNQVYYGKNMTASLMASIPTLLVYMFLGRYFLRGLLSGSLKG